MLVDARTVPDGSRIEADVCIVGAGAAGITMARELRRRPLRVVVLESGGLEPDRATRSLSRGEVTGHPYFRLDQARSLLVYAFANDIIQRIKVEPIRAQLEDVLLTRQHLPHYQEM